MRGLIPRIATYVAVLASAFMFTACGGPQPDASEDPGTFGNVLHLDTLGAGSVASLRAEPVVVVGMDSNEPEYLFHRVRDGVLTDDGFWIANGGSNEIRFFSSDGTFRFALGGPGEGPGEFRSLSHIFLLEPDSLLAFDDSGRVTVFGPEGKVVRTFDVPWLQDRLQATSYVRVGAREFAALVSTPRDPRQHIGDTLRDSVELVLMDASGGGYRRTGVLLPDRWWTFTSTAAGLRASSPPDGPSALLGVLGPNLVTSTSESPELQIWPTDSLDPALAPGAPVDREPGQSGDIAPRVIDQILGSDDGGLWVGLHPAAEDAGRTWIRIDSDAQVAARLDLPNDVWLLDARGNRLLVRAADSEGNSLVAVLAVR